jgi:hypothetical protein
MMEIEIQEEPKGIFRFDPEVGHTCELYDLETHRT